MHSRLRSILTYTALPYVRLELPGWGRLLRPLGVLDEAAWRDAPVKSIRGKLHGYQMRMELSNWSDRQSFLLGRYYDLSTQLLLMDILSKGDTFVDVGANIGMITMLAARLVGPAGQVHSAEPNPVAFARLKDHVERNHLDHVKLYPMALSDSEGEMTLSVVRGHSGSGTLASRGDVDASQVQIDRYTVPVAVGDRALSGDARGAMMLKIDVEGFECRVIRGMHDTISRHQPAIIVEAVPTHLKRAGSSVEEMFDLLGGLGYIGFHISTRTVLTRHRSMLLPCRGAAEGTAHNLLWIPRTGVWRERIERRHSPSVFSESPSQAMA